MPPALLFSVLGLLYPPPLAHVPAHIFSVPTPALLAYNTYPDTAADEARLGYSVSHSNLLLHNHTAAFPYRRSRSTRRV